MCPAYITYLVDSALQMLLESEYNQDHRTWQDSSSVRSILFVGLNMDQAIYEDFGKCVSPSCNKNDSVPRGLVWVTSVSPPCAL